MIKESKRFGREDEERGEGEKVKETRKWEHRKLRKKENERSCGGEERKWKRRRDKWRGRRKKKAKCRWVWIKQRDNCLQRLSAIRTKQRNAVCGCRLCCEWQISCKWMIMACLDVARLQRLCSILFPVNIAAFGRADLSAVLSISINL